MVGKTRDWIGNFPGGFFNLNPGNHRKPLNLEIFPVGPFVLSWYQNHTVDG